MALGLDFLVDGLEIAVLALILGDELLHGIDHGMGLSTCSKRDDVLYLGAHVLVIVGLHLGNHDFLVPRKASRQDADRFPQS